MKPETKELIKGLESGIVYTKGEVQTNKDGLKYRYDDYNNKYKTTPYWLVLLFDKALKANKSQDCRLFYDDGYCFAFNRAKFVGQKHGNIVYSKLIKL